jgi:hypothetical protein
VGSIPGKARDCFLLATGSGAHPASYEVGTGDFSPGVKRMGHEADHSFPSSAQVKNVSS